VRIVVAEDSVLLREGIVMLLENAGFDVVGQAGDAEDLVRKVGAHRPDVAVVDVRMPPGNSDDGLKAAILLRSRQPGLGVLVLSQYVEPAYAQALLADTAEGVGYLLKDRIGDVDRFIEAVRRVGNGGSALDPEVVRHLMGRPAGQDALAPLTARERETLELMAEGRSNRAICEAFGISERAVEKNVTSIFGKLGLTHTPDDHRRVLAVLAYLRS
jgi:DNA-binding NarL/FixJ family response regulator